jgi:hypothetical protein
VSLGDTLQTVALDPTSFDARLAVESQLWDNYKFNRLIVHYVPIVAKTQAGQFVMYYDADIQDSTDTALGIAALQVATAHEYNIASAICDRVSLNVKPSCFASKLFLRPSGDDLLNIQGFVRFMWSGADIVGPLALGLIYIDYEVEFYNPNLTLTNYVEPAARFDLIHETASTDRDFYPMDILSASDLNKLASSCRLHSLKDSSHNYLYAPPGAKADCQLMLNLVSSYRHVSSVYNDSHDRYYGVYAIPSAIISLWAGDPAAALSTLSVQDDFPHTGFLAEGGYWLADKVAASSNQEDPSTIKTTTGLMYPIVMDPSRMQDIAVWYKAFYSLSETVSSICESGWYFLPTIHNEPSLTVSYYTSKLVSSLLGAFMIYFMKSKGSPSAADREFFKTPRPSEHEQIIKDPQVELPRPIGVKCSSCKSS